MSQTTAVPLGQPRFRWSELNETHSRYDRTIAAPSDNTLVLMWSLLAAVSAIVSVVVGVVFLGIFTNKERRSSPFNMYLLFLMAPDFFISFACFLTCILSAAVGHYWSPSMCGFQSFYLVFGMASNAWINAIIASEIHRLLKQSHQRMHYRPPSNKSVATKCLVIYAYSVFLGCLFLIGGLPHGVNSISGVVCLVVEYDRASTLFFWLVFVPALLGIPFVYVLWVCYDIKVKKLLPPAGKRRLLSIYFFRIAIVFVVMWFPCAFCFYILRGVPPPWVNWAFGMWTHLQGLVSAAMTLMKPDVYEGTMEVLRCRCFSKTPSSDISSPRRSVFGGFRGWSSRRTLSSSRHPSRTTPSTHGSSSRSMQKRRSMDSVVASVIDFDEEDPVAHQPPSVEQEPTHQPKDNDADDDCSLQPGLLSENDIVPVRVAPGNEEQEDKDETSENVASSLSVCSDDDSFTDVEGFTVSNGAVECDQLDDPS